MITRAVTIVVAKDMLERMSADEADKYIKHKALHQFFDELVQHIEAESIDDNMPNYYMDNMVTFRFKLTGGSLPDHEGNT